MPYCLQEPSHQLHGQNALQGFETAKKATLQFLETFKDKIEAADREILLCVARTSLRTKLYQDLADQLTDIVVDAVLTIRKEDEPLDLYMVMLMLLCTAPQPHCVQQSYSKASSRHAATEYTFSHASVRICEEHEPPDLKIITLLLLHTFNTHHISRRVLDAIYQTRFPAGKVWIYMRGIT